MRKQGDSRTKPGAFGRKTFGAEAERERIRREEEEESRIAREEEAMWKEANRICRGEEARSEVRKGFAILPCSNKRS